MFGAGRRMKSEIDGADPILDTAKEDGTGSTINPQNRSRIARLRGPNLRVEESTHGSNQYNREGQAKMASFQSISYLPIHSKIYLEWLKTHFTASVVANWVMMALIGVVTGLVGAALKNLIQFFTKVKFMHVQSLLARHQFMLMWFNFTSISLILALVAAAVVVYGEPAAAGSGVPEVMAYLNGVSIPKIFRARTLFVKCVSVGLAVASGLFGGNEGPMIHIGASIGKIISQGTQLRNGWTIALFKRFRNMFDRRNFISAGAAAGVASAFGAPVGGLLFVLEEISSFWSHQHAWQTFFCCMVATLTTSLICNSFEAFEFTGTFGLFSNKHSYFVYVDVAMDSQLKMFLPVVVLGVLGGFAGVAFTWLNLKICGWRNRWIACKPWQRVMEVSILAVVTASVCVLLPTAFECLPVDCAAVPDRVGCTSRLRQSGMESGEVLHQFTCPDGFFNPGATLFFATPETTIERLLSRNTHFQFDYGPVISLLIVYILLACYTSGMAQSSGIMVPSILIGATLGRLSGLVVTDIMGVPPTDGERDWQDPGAFALIGAAAYFSGVTRLTMSLTVIFMEITNETHFLLPVMTAIVVARLTADACMEPLYHKLMHLKYLPFLPDELHATACLELSAVKDVMSAPAVTVPLFGPVSKVARVMLASTHSAFPVVEPGSHGEVFKGVILRNHVYSILAREELFVDPPTSAPLSLSSSMPLSPSFGGVPSTSEGDGDAETSSIEGDIPKIAIRRLSVKMDATNRIKYGSVINPELMANLDDRLPPVSVYPDLPLSTTSAATPTAMRPTDADAINREALIARLMSFPEFDTKWVNLSPYVDMSSYSVPETFSLERSYNLFRTMGLRHITVVNKYNNVVGMISRKDLLSQHVAKMVGEKEKIGRQTGGETRGQGRRRRRGGQLRMEAHRLRSGRVLDAGLALGSPVATVAEEPGPWSVETLDRSVRRGEEEEEERERRLM